MADTDAVEELKALIRQQASGSVTNLSVAKPLAEFNRQKLDEKLGAPVDYTESPPFLERVGAAFRRDPEQVLAYWQNLYGRENVKILPDGKLAVKRRSEERGKDVFMTVDESQLTLKDLDTLIGVAPEIAGSVLALRGVRGTGSTWPRAGRFAKDAVAGALGAETAGAFKDIGMQAIDPGPIDLGEIAASRGKMAAVDVALGYGMAGAMKAGGKLISPFAKDLPPIQVDALAGIEQLKKEGIDFKLTPGQKTGSPFLLRSEVELSRLPGASSAMDRFNAEQSKAAQEYLNIIQGLPRHATEADRAAIPTVEELTGRIREVVSGKLEPVQGALSSARQKLVEEANQEILSRISQSTIPQRQLYKSNIGEAVRGKVQAKLNDFQATSKAYYNAAYDLPGGRDRILVAPSMAKKADAYLKSKLPPDGLESFVPSNVTGLLKELAETGQTKFSVQDLVAMRNEVSNLMKVGEAVPGVKAHHLGQIRDMLTSGIEEAANRLPNKALRDAWRQANAYYRENVGQFQTPLISRILKPAEAPGSIGDRDIFSRLVSGDDKIQEIKKFLGPQSPEFLMLKRGIADDLYETSLHPGQRLLHAKSFLNKLADLKAKNREVFDEVFGKNGDYLLLQAQQMHIGQADKIAAEAIEQGIRNPSLYTNLRNAIESEKALDKTYQNEIFKMIGSKTAPGPGFDPNQFVSRFVRAQNAKPEEIKQFMALIAHDADLTWKLRAKTVQEILNDAARNSTEYDRVALRVDPNRVVSADKLQKLINPDSDTRKVYEAVLGDEVMGRLNTIATVLKPIEYQSSAFAGAGGISGGMQVARFWQGGVVGAVDKGVHNLVGAMVLTSPFTRNVWPANRALTPERLHSWITGMLYTEQGLKMVLDEFGVGGMRDAGYKVKQGIDGMVRENQMRAMSTNTLTDQQILDALRQVQP